MAEPGTTRAEKHVRPLFPDDVISRVQAPEYGDDPAVEPGDVAVRVFLPRPDQPEGGEADEEIVGSFEKANRERLRKLNDELRRVIAWVEFQVTIQRRRRSAAVDVLKIGRGAGPLSRWMTWQRNSTPVMTRLGPADLATVDTLITAGIAGSRAEVLRWAVGRIRENPAYVQLENRVREISELKPGSDWAQLTRRDQVTLTAGRTRRRPWNRRRQIASSG